MTRDVSWTDLSPLNPDRPDNGLKLRLGEIGFNSGSETDFDRCKFRLSLSWPYIIFQQYLGEDILTYY